MNQSVNLPVSMRAIAISQPGGPEVLQLTGRPLPQPGPGEVLIRHCAAGVNGADVMQRKGIYDPPAGASDLPGLEVAGEIVSVGAGVTRFRPGDRVAALIPGGGYAEYGVADCHTTMPLPAGLSMTEAAALPETFMTVWLNMFQRGGFKAGDTILIHGGASGIGTTATMLAKAFGAGKIITTVGSERQRQASLQLGADVAILYKEQDYVLATHEATAGKGADLILDIIAGDYVARNFAAAAMNGRIVQIGIIAGPAKELDLFPLLSKRLTLVGSTLRSGTPQEKARLIEALSEQVWPLISQGLLKPVVDRTFELEEVAEAHRLMDSGQHIGKIVLTIRPE